MDYNAYEQGRQQGRREGNGGGGEFLVAIIAALLVVWTCLYPLSAIATGFAWYGFHNGLEPLSRNLQGFNRLLVAELLPAAGALAVLWKTSRCDHRLAVRPVYRMIRHIIRLCLLALVAGILHLWMQNHIPPADLLRPVIRGWVPFVDAAEHTAKLLAGDPLRLGLMALTAIGGHYWLARWQCGRRGWLEFLQSLQLRPLA